jgi:hypothetical protein
MLYLAVAQKYEKLNIEGKNFLKNNEYLLNVIKYIFIIGMRFVGAEL